MSAIADLLDGALHLGLGLLVPLVGAAMAGALVGAWVGRLLGIRDGAWGLILRGVAIVLLLLAVGRDAGEQVVDETQRAWARLPAIGAGDL